MSVYHVAYWQEGDGEFTTAWLACPREDFIVAQGRSREEAGRALRRLLKANIALCAAHGIPWRSLPVPADLLHHFDGELEVFDLSSAVDVKARRSVE